MNPTPSSNPPASKVKRIAPDPDQPEAPKETPDEKTVVIRADPNAPSKPAVSEDTIAREAAEEILECCKRLGVGYVTVDGIAEIITNRRALSRSNSSDTKKPLLDKLVADMRSIKDAANENGAGNPPDGYMDLEPKETSVADACYQHGMDVMEIAVLNWIHDQQAARDSSDTPKGEAANIETMLNHMARDIARVASDTDGSYQLTFDAAKAALSRIYGTPPTSPEGEDKERLDWLDANIGYLELKPGREGSIRQHIDAARKS